MSEAGDFVILHNIDDRVDQYITPLSTDHNEKDSRTIHHVGHSFVWLDRKQKKNDTVLLPLTAEGNS
jgi:hypothetical protein